MFLLPMVGTIRPQKIRVGSASSGDHGPPLQQPDASGSAPGVGGPPDAAALFGPVKDHVIDQQLPHGLRFAAG